MVDIRSIFRAVIDGVHAISPATWPDRGFSFEPGSLLRQPDSWIQLQSRNFRDCCLHLAGYPVSVNAYCYSSIDVEILIFYPYSIATDELQPILIEDALAIQNTIGRHPTKWGAADSISFLSQQPYDYVTLYDDNNEPIALVYAIPFRVEIKL